MYAVLAASVLLLAGRARLVGLVAVSLCVLVPFLIAPGMTSTGHVLAVAVGTATMALIQRRARRQRTMTTAPAAIAD
jgi:ABC-type branched-subunit amino acid transport system permease subunit